jgi:hypothetical protein
MDSDQEEKLDGLKLHVSQCRVCSRANKRANDFCAIGRLMFFAWVKNETPASIVELDEEQSIRVINEEAERGRKASSN